MTFSQPGAKWPLSRWPLFCGGECIYDPLPSITSVAAELYFVVDVAVVTGVVDPVVPGRVGSVLVDFEHGPLGARLVQVARHTGLPNVPIIRVVAQLTQNVASF